MLKGGFKRFLVELSKEDYYKLQSLVECGKYRTKVAVIRDLLRRVDNGVEVSVPIRNKKVTFTLLERIFEKFVEKFSNPLNPSRLITWPRVNEFFNDVNGSSKEDARIYVAAWVEEGWVQYCAHRGIRITRDLE